MYTPPPEEVPYDPVQTLNRIGRRVKITAHNSQVTIDAVGLLRGEIDAKLERLDARISSLEGGVSGVREVGARNEGKLDTMLGVLEAERKSRQQYEAAAAAAFAATTEVTRSRALSQIEGEVSDRTAEREERKERNRYRRELGLKILAAVAAIWAVISTIFLARCK